MKLTAVIIKGNPKFINNNHKAKSFYKEIKDYIESLGFKVSFDSGKPYSIPKKADLWIGHSRGCDRLKFAPENTAIIALGSKRKDAINHPRDNSIDESNVIPNDFHYIFTEKMKRTIYKLVGKSLKTTLLF